MIRLIRVSLIILLYVFVSGCVVFKSDIENKIQLNPKFILEPSTTKNRYNLYYLNNYISADTGLNETERKFWLQVQPNVTDVYFNDSLVVVTNMELERPRYHIFYLGKDSINFTYFKAKDLDLLYKKLTKFGITYKIELKSISDL